MTTGGTGPPGPLPEVGPFPGAPYAIKVPVFEGPLDLLLHLIRLNEVEITDIPVARIAEQYLEYVEVMHELNLDVAGEYLLMAATLAWIKSRMLLPVEREGEESEGPDPREELVARLLEYQRFKEVSRELGDRPLLGRDVFRVRTPDLEPGDRGGREIEVGLFELVEAYRRVLREARHGGRAHAIEVEPVTVRDCMLQIMRVLEAHASIDFEQMLREVHGARASLTVVVASFLGILELTRLEVRRLYQGVDGGGVPVGPIHLRRAAEPGDRTWTERIADVM